MLHTLAIAGYRSLKEFIVELSELTVVTGANGSGKSSLYRALRLLADAAQGRLVGSLAREGGLQSALWAGPEIITSEMLRGQLPIQGGRLKPVHLRLGMVTDDYCFSIELGLPQPSNSAFGLDPVIKRECLWRGTSQRPSTLWADRRNGLVRSRDAGGQWHDLTTQMNPVASMLTEFSDPEKSLDLMTLREVIRTWRFYDHFRTDVASPARRTQIGTYTPLLADDASDLAPALQTIREVGDADGLATALDDAFPGSSLKILVDRGQFHILFEQPGMLRDLSVAELSDGTLRYLLLLAVLYSPRNSELLVFNEPETSLHPDLLPALGRALVTRSKNTQILVVTHSQSLIESLLINRFSRHIGLEKVLGETKVAGAGRVDRPPWKWPAR